MILKPGENPTTLADGKPGTTAPDILLIAHAERYWKAECENSDRLAARIRLLIPLTGTLLGAIFVGVFRLSSQGLQRQVPDPVSTWLLAATFGCLFVAVLVLCGSILMLLMHIRGRHVGAGFDQIRNPAIRDPNPAEPPPSFRFGWMGVVIALLLLAAVLMWRPDWIAPPIRVPGLLVRAVAVAGVVVLATFLLQPRWNPGRPRPRILEQSASFQLELPSSVLDLAKIELGEAAKWAFTRTYEAARHLRVRNTLERERIRAGERWLGWGLIWTCLALGSYCGVVMYNSYG